MELVGSKVISFQYLKKMLSGTGERVFPPQTGLSFSSWFCVDKFSDPRTDPHCIRLLTLTRIVNNIREDHVVCLSVLLSARDKAIIVSTQETLLPPSNTHFKSF